MQSTRTVALVTICLMVITALLLSSRAMDAWAYPTYPTYRIFDIDSCSVLVNGVPAVEGQTIDQYDLLDVKGGSRGGSFLMVQDNGRNGSYCTSWSVDPLDYYYTDPTAVWSQTDSSEIFIWIDECVYDLYYDPKF